MLSPENINHSIHHRKVLEKLKKSYASIMGRLGDPLDDGTLYGPLHSKVIIYKHYSTSFFGCFCVLTLDLEKVGVDSYLQTIADAKAAGGTIEFGGNIIERLL